MTDVKICGVSTAIDVDAAISAGASHVGFNFFARSPRVVTARQAAALGARAAAHVVRVGVFVDPDDALLDSVVAGLDAVQLHGSEPVGRLAAVKARYGKPVWRAVGVATRDDIRAAIAAAGPADLLLFDAKAPRGAPLPGGNGVRFDWRLLGGVDVGRAWGLSGGLDVGSVVDAVALARPPLVDVASGVEEAPGVKSVAKIRAFIEAARRV